MGTRTLYLLRHGKAEPQGSGHGDHARALIDEGRRKVAEQAAALAPPPDLVRTSSSRRTVETVAALGLSEAIPVTTEDELYVAGTQTILDLVRSTDPSIQTLLVVGHNPAISQVVGLLAHADDRSQLSNGLRPGGLAVLDVATGWEGLVPGGCRLARLHP